MTDRRTMLTAAAAAWAVPLAANARPRRPVAAAGRPEYHVPGGTRGIQRGQFSYTATDRIEGYGVILVPDAKRLFMTPLTTVIRRV